MSITWTVFAIEEERFEALRRARHLRRLIDVLVFGKARASIGLDATTRVPRLVLGDAWRQFDEMLAAVWRDGDAWSTDLHRYHLERIAHPRVIADYWRTGYLAFTLDAFARMARSVLARDGLRLGPAQRVGRFRYRDRGGSQEWSWGHPLTWSELYETRAPLVRALAEAYGESQAVALWELATAMSDALGVAIAGGTRAERRVLVIVRTEGDEGFDDDRDDVSGMFSDWRATPRPGEASAWLEAARRSDRSLLEALLARGIDVDTRDEAGRSALFFAIAPFGGDPPLVAWLLERGANPNIRDARGASALDVGFDGVSSGLEANMMAHLADAFRAHGYRDERDFLGAWIIAEGPDAGQRLVLGRGGIESDLAWLRLSARSVAVDQAGCLRMHGDHATLLVHVGVALGSDGRARLSWNDGVTHPAEVVLRR